MRGTQPITVGQTFQSMSMVHGKKQRIRKYARTLDSLSITIYVFAYVHRLISLYYTRCAFTDPSNNFLVRIVK